MICLDLIKTVFHNDLPLCFPLSPVRLAQKLISRGLHGPVDRPSLVGHVEARIPFPGHRHAQDQLREPESIPADYFSPVGYVASEDQTDELADVIYRAHQR